MRGIHFVQIWPVWLLKSTLQSVVRQEEYLCQEHGRNFAQIDGVLIDPTVLETLGKRELIEWMGEVIKYGLIEDPELWDLLSEMDGSVESILSIQESLIEHS